MLFWSWFNVRAFRAERTTATWTEARFRFWQAFTLRSILAQREGDWRYWLVCSRELRHLTDPLLPAIVDPRVEMVFDDECCDRLARLRRADRYLMSRIDSDDLYHPLAASTLLKQRPTTPFLQFNQGFALDVSNGEVLPWHSRSSPFYTHVYGEEIRRLGVWDEPNHTTVARSATVLGSGHFLVSLHSSNTSTTRAHASGAALPTERSMTIAAQFGIGGRRGMDDLAATSRVPVKWEFRWQQLHRELRVLVNVLNAHLEGTPVSLSAVALLQLVCEMTAARLVAVIDHVPAAVVVRSLGTARCDLVVSTLAYSTAARDALPPSLAVHASGSAAAAVIHAYDVVYVDLRRTGSDPTPLRSALDAVAVTGLLVVAGVDPDSHDQLLRSALGGVIIDRYPEIEARALDPSGRTCWLLGRGLSS